MVNNLNIAVIKFAFQVSVVRFFAAALHTEVNLRGRGSRRLDQRRLEPEEASNAEDVCRVHLHELIIVMWSAT